MLARLAAALCVTLACMSCALPARARAPQPGVGQVIRDCRDCPELIVTPPGEFLMGSPDTEPHRAADEGPVHRVVIPHPLAVGRYPVTRDQYEAFVSAVQRPVRSGCTTGRAVHGTWAADPQGTLRSPGFDQGGDHPVVCVGWDDAQAYVAWLNTQAPGRHYRLLSEAEWEYLARAGTRTIYPWGDDPDGGCAEANIADAMARAEYPEWTATAACSDGALHTTPVGAYKPDAFGLYDMVGDVGVWVQDCTSPSYDASAEQDCKRRITRGCSWGSLPEHCRVADRLRYVPNDLEDDIGIRVVRDLD